MWASYYKCLDKKTCKFKFSIRIEKKRLEIVCLSKSKQIEKHKEIYLSFVHLNFKQK